ncbi:MAG: hypothetical protein L0K73_04935 [Corynebacterium variabile]|uniref:hypothetical protein n=1 Tax=Corynebacterium variabile TaxID=1727 RepID=UPI002647EB8E|nr:hypothetical protein [Corynebacterium variabile]MDN6536143.1 hypothetical protein [Corynebacterium variabile]
MPADVAASCGEGTVQRGPVVLVDVASDDGPGVGVPDRGAVRMGRQLPHDEDGRRR